MFLFSPTRPPQPHYAQWRLYNTLMDFIWVLVFHPNGGVIVIITTGISCAGYFLETNLLHFTFFVASRNTCYRKQLSNSSHGGKQPLPLHLLCGCFQMFAVCPQEHFRSTGVPSSNDLQSGGGMKQAHKSWYCVWAVLEVRGFQSVIFRVLASASCRDWLEKGRLSALILEQLNQKPQGGA